jgi:PAS domain S-box-containing protein
MKGTVKYNRKAIGAVADPIKVGDSSAMDMEHTHENLEGKSLELEGYADNAPIGLHWLDANGIIKWANKAQLDMLGYDANEYIGHHISEFHAEAEKVEEILRRLNNNETLNAYEASLRCKDGSIKIVQISSNVFLEAGKLVHIRCVTIDITEQINLFKALKESEQRYRELSVELEEKVTQRTAELRRSEERYHKMIDEVEDYAIFLLDANGIIQNWNKGAEKIKGYKEDEIVGKSFELFYRPEDREAGLPYKLLGIAREQGKAVHEGWRVRKDGSMFWGSVVLTAVHDAQNNLIGFSKVTRDLTERKLAEDRLREYNNDLQFQNKELEQFAYAASHDMKEPLRKIHFYNSYVVENASQQLDEKSREYLNRSINAVERMSDLIEDLLMYSTTTANAEYVEEVDLNEVVEEIVLLHKDELEQKNARIELEELPVVCGVAFQFKQLLANLINNSLKYRHPDRQAVIHIRCTKVNGSQIDEKDAEPGKKYYRISVEDNGLGFEQEYAEKIFELFQRLNISGVKGSGIGLAICKKIMQNHKGFIKATGKPGEGARFDIYIPG